MSVESPCIGVCQLEEEADVCAGCHRTLAEIAAWSRSDDTEKLLVLTAVRERQAAPKAGDTLPPPR